jgi:putative FmdB family regulatory protein
MPTYDYRCPNGHDFEHFYRKISDAGGEVACPTCGAVGQRRLSAGAGLLFKGSGFYLTDYGKNAHRTSSPEGASTSSNGEGASESKAPSSDSSKSEGATAAKPEAAPTSSTKSEGAKSADKPSTRKTKGGDSK